ncbi:ankyrin repeat domain-containing protein [Tenacibaculum sp. SG-28]|uniref:ankyrin repeat domain-containing protein n=1 Tax=Tenacibaculum sp. SG-28 TaxID=754426 RepID=UPI000CF56B79|nr:ankyrin repeat domain-containing protein [Tenacibaculum sp. SG-28]PQJ21742.1 hypothetical protein BSU00_06595 [Tenacibaculum sp. SG-28]
MTKKLFITSMLLFFVNVLIGQELDKETLRNIYEGNTAGLAALTQKEAINKCYSVKGNSYSILAISIKMKQMKSLQYFTEKGADINKVCMEKTPIMYAVKYGQLEMVKYLTEQGATLNTQTSRGRTALDYAKKYEQSEIEAYLKEKWQ